MIVAWFIGVILSCLGIWLLKNSRQNKWMNPKDRQPVLKMWMLILLMIGTVIPNLNIVVGLTVIIWWAIEAITDDWSLTKGDNIVRFLKKPIK